MKCQQTAFWRGYLDNDSPASPAARQAGDEHLKDCENCRLLVEQVKTTAVFVREVAEIDNGRPDVAWRKFLSAAQPAGAAFIRPTFNLKPVFAAVAALALVGAFSAKPVRSLAGELLQLFRAEKFAAIKVDPAVMAGFDLDRLGDFELTPPSSRQVNSLDQAKTVSGLAPLVEPANLPLGLSRVSLRADTTGTLSLKFDLQEFRNYLAAKGIKDPDLPASLEGAQFIGRLPASVHMEFDNLKLNRLPTGDSRLVFIQGGMPTVEAPPDVDFNQLRSKLLALSIFPDYVRDQLLALDDWQKTFPIPYPANDATSEKITIRDGQPGIFFTAKKGTKILIWTSGGRAFGLIAPTVSEVSKNNLLAIAASLQ